jgi:hypothetical protein
LRSDIRYRSLWDGERLSTWDDTEEVGGAVDRFSQKEKKKKKEIH